MSEEIKMLSTWKVISIVTICFLGLYFFIQKDTKEVKELPEEVNGESLSMASRRKSRIFSRNFLLDFCNQWIQPFLWFYPFFYVFSQKV